MYSRDDYGCYGCDVSIPLEEKQVEVVVFLGEEVAKDTGGVTAADLIGRQAEVDTLDKVPELGHKVLIEHPTERQTNRRYVQLYYLEGQVMCSGGVGLHGFWSKF